MRIPEFFECRQGLGCGLKSLFAEEVEAVLPATYWGSEDAEVAIKFSFDGGWERCQVGRSFGSCCRDELALFKFEVQPYSGCRFVQDA